MDGYFSFNSQVLPAASLTADATPVIKLVDPLLYNLATFFAQLLNTNLQPRFSNEAQHTGLNHASLDNWVDGYAVAQITDFPLNNLTLKDTDFKFPLLNVICEEEHSTDLTLTNRGVVRQFCISWVLPPLTVRQYNRLYQFFGEATKIWTGYGRQGYDPKVNSNSVWKACNVAFGHLGQVEYGNFYGFTKEGKEADFPAIQIRCSFAEREQEPVIQNYPTTISNVFIEVDGYDDGYNIANPLSNFVDGYVYPNATITSISPPSGSIGGNTLVSISGTGFSSNIFQKNSQITIAGVQVRGFVVKSPTIILARTNPGIGFPGGSAYTGSVVLTDNQGNSTTLTNSYTYTTP